MTGSAHPTARRWDERTLGLLDGEARASFDAHVGSCARCAEIAAERDRDGARFVAVVLPAALPRLRSRRRRWWWGVFAVPALAAAAALLLVVRPSDDLGVKGNAPTLKVFVRRGDHASTVQDGATLMPGDALRFRVGPSGHPYLMLASVDGTGTASVYYPFRGTRSGEVPKDRAVDLPGSIVLDDSPGPERMFVLASDEPLDAEPVRAALEAIGRGGADAIRARRELAVAGAAQTTVLFEKKDPPR